MTTLENLKEGLKAKNLMDIAIAIVKYQKFKTPIAISKMPNNIKEATKVNYFTLGCRYLKNREKSKYVPSTLYNCIDELLSKHLQPLTPSIEEQKRTYNRNYTTKKAVPPVAKLDEIKRPITSNNIEYGVKMSNTDIKIFKNRDLAIGFARGLTYCGKENIKVITMEIGDINEKEEE